MITRRTAEPLAAPLLEAFEPVRRDLSTATIDLVLQPSPNTRAANRHAGMLYARVRLVGRVEGDIGMDTATGQGRRVLNLADQVQDYVLETPWSDGAVTTWPACVDDHRHPMEPVLLREDTDPFWMCPRTGERLLIGTHPGRRPGDSDLVRP